jgi:hypothetical protein
LPSRDFDDDPFWSLPAVGLTANFAAALEANDDDVVLLATFVRLVDD